MITEPVEVVEPICESTREKTFDVPCSVLYRVEATCPDGTVKVFDSVRAYTKSVALEPDGKLTIEIGSKVAAKKARAPYPYHYLFKESVLCVVKINKMNTLSDVEAGYRMFALNYNLFCFPWNVCLVMHNSDEERIGTYVYVTSRAEWDRGDLRSYNREVQMFLKVPTERGIPVNYASLMMEDGIRGWMDVARAEMVRKGC